MLGPLLILGSLIPASAATMSVNVAFTDIGSGNFRYDLTVSNTGSDDIPILSINDAPANDPLIASTLTAPPGFFKNYDPLGVIDFGEDTATFTAGSTFPGFSFESSADPGTAFTDFTAFTNAGESVVVTTTLVPEPSSSLLALAGLLAGCARRRR